MGFHHKISQDFKGFEIILWIYKISKYFMKFKDTLKRNDYNTRSIITFSIHTLILWEREEGREEREREERDSKILKEKQSQEISCFHERLFLAKISLQNPTKSNLLNNPLKFEWFWIPRDFF